MPGRLCQRMGLCTDSLRTGVGFPERRKGRNPEVELRAARQRRPKGRAHREIDQKRPARHRFAAPCIPEVCQGKTKTYVQSSMQERLSCERLILLAPLCKQRSRKELHNCATRWRTEGDDDRLGQPEACACTHDAVSRSLYDACWRQTLFDGRAKAQEGEYRSRGRCRRIFLPCLQVILLCCRRYYGFAQNHGARARLGKRRAVY